MESDACNTGIGAVLGLFQQGFGNNGTSYLHLWEGIHDSGDNCKGMDSILDE